MLAPKIRATCPMCPCPTSLHAVHEMRAALDGAEAAAIIVPSRSVRSVARQAAEYAPPHVPVAVCAKGIEAETGLLMTQVAEEELNGNPVGCVSGPTFAAETALGHPTAATVAFPFGTATG
jgi:glycerol-3-phosphate dehydrogenase (NAD(P)+)